ncbi:DUF484 family protein [Limnohabitans lacus]|jgi:uncharacterized protein YigA (DUF484 family)|uniref:DUF484 family protein n=1 Tax=Limnohabitans lacus TaxID=3045173 RepID=A0ABT6X771_9BURK|nr:DUF484 family protein [Limnohabitans sp. HM2-2]MDI9233968.1 DUF484 family protein [Limnohabitans sp. HM2-2]
MSTSEPMSPITEDDIADYLVNTPDFFERHASLLATVQLTHPQSHRAVGLQERQAQMLRDKIKGLEHRIMDMIRHGNENMILTDKLHRWSCDLLVAPPEHLVESAVDNIRELFQVPQVTLRLWGVNEAHSQAAYAQGVTEAVQELAASLDTPYVGPNTGYEAVQWLTEPAQAASLALLALRAAPGQSPFGLLVLASPDGQRFNSQMGTDLLERLAELAGAALSVLRAPQA